MFDLWALYTHCVLHYSICCFHDNDPKRNRSFLVGSCRLLTVGHQHHKIVTQYKEETLFLLSTLHALLRKLMLSGHCHSVNDRIAPIMLGVLLRQNLENDRLNNVVLLWQKTDSKTTDPYNLTLYSLPRILKVMFLW